MNFPVGLSLSQELCDGAPCSLFVVNANFDLNFDQGTLQSYDLVALERAIAGCAPEMQPCEFDDPCDFMHRGGEVRIRSFAATLNQGPSGNRLYVPLQSTGEIVYVDVENNGVLRCHDSTSSGVNDTCDARGEGLPPPTCDKTHRKGERNQIGDRDLSLPKDSVGLITGDLSADFGAPPGSGNYILMAHRSGYVSLFLDNLPNLNIDSPVLIDVLSGFSPALTNIAFDALTQTVYLTSARDGVIGRVQVRVNSADVSKSFLVNAGGLDLTGLDDGQDTRDMLFPRSLSSTGNPATFSDEQAWVLTRRPEALALVDLRASELDARQPLDILKIIKVGSGPSRSLAFTLGTPARQFIVVSAFDSRDLYVVDADLGEVRAVVRGFSGPYELAFDAVRGFIYVADFRASVVRVVDMKPLLDNKAPFVVASLGEPRTVNDLD